MENTVRELLNPSSELKPLPTGIKSRGSRLKGVKAVIFDIYGTLLVSGSGDVGTALEAGTSGAFAAAMKLCGIDKIDESEADSIRKRFFSLISETHEKMKKNGYPYPEIDIIAIWRNILSAHQAEYSVKDFSFIPPELAAAAYESTVNPVYPMPGSAQLLEIIKISGVKLGIVSNAQFYTPIIFENLFGGSFSELGFNDELCLFSYIERRSKPDPALFKKLSAGLSGLGITPAETVFAGNDMLKDIMPAALAGYKTALFAGDRRSLRMHDNNDACRNIKPDVILNRLIDLIDFIKIGEG